MKFTELVKAGSIRMYLIYMHIHRPDKCRKREMLGNYLLLLLLRFLFLFVFTFYIIFEFSYSCSSKATAPTPCMVHRLENGDTFDAFIRSMPQKCTTQHNTHKLHDRNLFECVFFSIFATNAYLFFLFVLSLFMQQQRFIFYGDKNYNAQAMKFIRLRRRSQNITVNEMPI